MLLFSLLRVAAFKAEEATSDLLLALNKTKLGLPNRRLHLALVVPAILVNVLQIIPMDAILYLMRIKHADARAHNAVRGAEGFAQKFVLYTPFSGLLRVLGHVLIARHVVTGKARGRSCYDNLKMEARSAIDFDYLMNVSFSSGSKNNLNVFSICRMPLNYILF